MDKWKCRAEHSRLASFRPSSQVTSCFITILYTEFLVICLYIFALKCFIPLISWHKKATLDSRLKVNYWTTFKQIKTVIYISTFQSDIHLFWATAESLQLDLHKYDENRIFVRVYVEEVSITQLFLYQPFGLFDFTSVTNSYLLIISVSRREDVFFQDLLVCDLSAENILCSLSFNDLIKLNPVENYFLPWRHSRHCILQISSELGQVQGRRTINA